MVLWGGGAVALLRQLRVQCFEEWCWHGRAEKLRGTVQCQGRGEGGVWLCWTLSCQTHPLRGVCWWRLPRRYREVPWLSLLVPGSAETVTLCVMHCLMSNLEQDRWLRWIICQLQHPMRAAGKSSASWRDRTGQRAGWACQPSSVPQRCCLLGRTMQRSLSARVGPELSSSSVWFARTRVDLCVHPLAAGSTYVLCCYGLREQSWPP